MFSLEKSKPRKIWKLWPGDSEHFLPEGGVFVLFPYLHIFSSPHSGHLVRSSKVNERGRPRHPEGGAWSPSSPESQPRLVCPGSKGNQAVRP